MTPPDDVTRRLRGPIVEPSQSFACLRGRELDADEDRPPFVEGLTQERRRTLLCSEVRGVHQDRPVKRDRET